ncbi:MAG: hypothetical protein AMJ55_09135 [Gammaproteobacteria bacterium SG8_15]|nr:MAG: hypothetical protein AMJ55_09135 [Gammaproteobacteria bacterium SG8_15]
MYCASYTEGDPAAKGSLGVGGLGAAFLVCPNKPNTDDCTKTDPKDDHAPSWDLGLPGKFGAIIGIQKNPDGTVCVWVGLMGGFGGPNFSTGDI